MSKVKIPLQTALLLASFCAAVWSSDRHDYLALGGWMTACALLLSRYGR